MKTSALVSALVAILSMLPARADAQQLMLQIQDGLVTLDAQNVPVRQILAEWARIGGARIVNGEKVGGGPVTLQLNRVPERQAIDTILRGVSGYMLASRQTGSGVSGFDRILIMPTSSAPRAAAVQATAPFSSRPMPAPPAPESVEQPVVADDADDQDEPEAGDPDVAGEEEEPVVQPQPGMNRRFQRGPAFPTPMGAQQQPFMPQGAFPGQPQPVDADEESVAPPTTTPFNVPPGASATPGVIAPVPQDPQQPNPRQRRPPL